jgi:hypothetical protein
MSGFRFLEAPFRLIGRSIDHSHAALKRLNLDSGLSIGSHAPNLIMLIEFDHLNAFVAPYLRIAKRHIPALPNREPEALASPAPASLHLLLLAGAHAHQLLFAAGLAAGRIGFPDLISFAVATPIVLPAFRLASSKIGGVAGLRQRVG